MNEKIKAYVLKKLELSKKRGDFSQIKIKSLEIDSLTLVELVYETEKEFNLSVPDDKVAEMIDMSVEEVINLFISSKNTKK